MVRLVPALQKALVIAIVAVVGAGGTALAVSAFAATPPPPPPASSPARVLGSAPKAILPAPADAAWPPVPAADPDPIQITVPVVWSEADREQAHEWKAVQQDTRSCLRERGIEYRYVVPWQEYDDEGTMLDVPVPPSDWTAEFAKPSMSYLDSSKVCWSRALVLSGRAPIGPLDFPARLPRFEPADFTDAGTLDMPEEWTADDREQGAREWRAELITRQCMADAGFPSYGMPPVWLDQGRTMREDPWLTTLPVADRERAGTALNGEQTDPYDWQKAGCWGRGVHDSDAQ